MRIKKFLAIAIVLAIVVSLMPAVFAEDGALTYNYVFNSSSHNLGASPTTADRRLTSGLHSIDNVVDSVSSPWGFVNVYGQDALASYAGYVNWAIRDNAGNGVVFAPGENSVSGVRAALAFEISASEGVYDAKLSVITGSNSPELEVYLIPKSEITGSWEYDSANVTSSKENFYKSVEALSANYRIGKIDLYGDGKSKDIYIGRVAVSSENYYLVFVPNGKNKDASRNADNQWGMMFTNFKLDSVSDTSAVLKEYTFNPATDYAYRNSGSSYTHLTENNVFSTADIQVRRYGVVSANGPFVAFRVSVDTDGKYSLSFKTNKPDVAQAAPAVYLSERSSASDVQSIGDKVRYGYFDFSKLSEADTYATVTTDGLSESPVAEFSLKANKDYYIVLVLDAKSLALNGQTTKMNLVLGTDYKLANNGSLTDMNGNVLGNSTHGLQKLYISGIKLTQIKAIEDEEIKREEAYIADRELYNELTSVKAENNTINTLESYSPTATVTIVTQDVASGDSVVNDVVNETVNVNAEFTPSVPSVSDDYEFLYWAIGLGANRKIVSFDKEDYSFVVAPGRNMVYAVYRKRNNDTKYAFFFDGSRTVMGKKNISEGSVVLPSLPGEMPGFGAAVGWKYTGEDDEVALSESAEVTGLEDDTFFVASYEDKQTVSITIDGKVVEVLYGTEINLGEYASIRENKSGYNVFNYWKKNDEIISLKPDYSFLAYEDCVITSTYSKYEPTDKSIRRISMSVDTKTGVTFAEFIGLDSAIEKGILFGDPQMTTYTNASAKAVMQTDSNVFSVINKTEKTAIGYAIFNDGSIVYSDR